MRSRAIAFLLLLVLTVSVRGELPPRIDRALCFGDPEIVGAQLSPNGRDLAFKSSDGLEVPASLTQPRGVPASKLPLIVIPHGGPSRRDTWGYNTYSQFFASRGYAVLQPNFRASFGFGKELLDTGNLRWGEKMQDDGADVTKSSSVMSSRA